MLWRYIPISPQLPYGPHRLQLKMSISNAFCKSSYVDSSKAWVIQSSLLKVFFTRSATPCYMRMENFHTLLDQADYDRFSDHTTDECYCMHPNCLDEIRESASWQILSAHETLPRLLLMGADLCYGLYRSLFRLGWRVREVTRKHVPSFRP